MDAALQQRSCLHFINVLRFLCEAKFKDDGLTNVRRHNQSSSQFSLLVNIGGYI